MVKKGNAYIFLLGLAFLLVVVLSFTLNHDDLTGYATFGASVVCPAEDVNEDMIVDLDDIVLIMDNYGLAQAQATNVRADVDGSGTVGDADLDMVVDAFGNEFTCDGQEENTNQENTNQESSSGGGGGGGPSFIDKLLGNVPKFEDDYPIHLKLKDYEVTEEGKSIEGILTGTAIFFELNGKDYIVGVDQVLSGFMDFTVSTTGQKIRVVKGSEANLDLDEDGDVDLRLYVSDVDGRIGNAFFDFQGVESSLAQNINKNLAESEAGSLVQRAGALGILIIIVMLVSLAAIVWILYAVLVNGGRFF